MEKGEQNEAAIQYLALLALQPTHVEANFQLGKIYANVSRLPKRRLFCARQWISACLRRRWCPARPVLLGLENYKELLELLESTPKHPQPTDPRALAEYAVLRGHALFETGDVTGANTQFQLR
jgi:hypothetical protein